MKKYNLLSLILLSVFFIGCGDAKKDKLTYFSFDESGFKTVYEPSGSVDLSIVNKQNKQIDSIIYYVNDQKVASAKAGQKVPFAFKGKKLGYQNFKALVYFEGDNVETTARVEVVSDINPKLLTYKVVNTFPHDTLSFTEGFEFYHDTLLESSGQYNQSKLIKTDYKTGKAYKTVALKGQYFGEGLTVINNKIYQITWKEKTGFIYDAVTLKLEKSFAYDKDTEGWGMANDGKKIYQSDGTEKIWTMDPETQKMEGYINVYTNTSKIKAVNELEWINGKIYGNIWQKDAIAVINPLNGAVEAVLDLSGLRKSVKSSQAEVLNGIAYNKKNNTIFVTGKYWDKVFEIKVSE